MSNYQKYGLMPAAEKQVWEIVPIALGSPGIDLQKILEEEANGIQDHLAFNGFEGKPGQIAITAEAGCGICYVGVGSYDDLYALGDLPSKLPAGKYEIRDDITPYLSDDQKKNSLWGGR